MIVIEVQSLIISNDPIAGCIDILYLKAVAVVQTKTVIENCFESADLPGVLEVVVAPVSVLSPSVMERLERLEHHSCE